MKKAVFLRKSSEKFLTKNLIINGDPSREQRERFVRMTKNNLFIDFINRNKIRREK